MGQNQSTRTRWPMQMPWLTPKDFAHGFWAVRAKDLGDYDNDHSYVADKFPGDILCGTKCCLVGHVRHAFGLPADPGVGLGLPAQGEKFLRRFLVEAGYPPHRDSALVGHGSLQDYASDCFEGTVIDGDPEELTSKAAAKAWKATLAHFGYTEVA